MDICKNCNREFRTKFIFCPSCGSNLSLPDQIEELSEISYKEEIEKEHLEAYKLLKNKIDKLSWIDEKLRQQDVHLQSLKTELHKSELRVKEINTLSEKIDAKINEMGKLTWSSFKSRITGSLDEKKSQQEAEAVRLMNEKQALNNEIKNLKKQIKTAEDQYRKIETAIEKRKILDHKLLEYVNRATQGIKDPIEDKIELELSNLSEKIEPYVITKSKFQTALSYLQTAQEYLREANINLEKKEADLISKNRLLKDAVTKSGLSEIRDTVIQASQFINQTFEILHQDSGKGSHNEHGLFKGNELWERFMKTFVKDLRTGFRNKKETQLQLSKAIADINKIIAWVNSQLTSVNFNIDELMKEIKNKEQDLLKERLRIIEDAANE